MCVCVCIKTDDFELSEQLEDPKVVARRDLAVDTVWGPFPGTIQSDATADGTSNEVRPRTGRVGSKVTCIMSVQLGEIHGIDGRKSMFLFDCVFVHLFTLLMFM